MKLTRLCSSWSFYVWCRNQSTATKRINIFNPAAICRCYSTQRKDSPMNVFDRKAKRWQKDRTSFLPDYKVYDYIKEEIAYRLSDRVYDIKRQFDVVVDLGCGRGHLSKNIYGDMVKTLYQVELSEKILQQAETSSEVPTYKVIADEEHFPFKDNSIDLVISSLSLHWVNDLPGCFRQVFSALKNDGVFLGCLFGGDTLFELRSSLQLAELEREGGFAPHVSPYTMPQDIGNLLHTSGYTMLTLDTDEMVITYPTMFELMTDLQGMGENACSWTRKISIQRDSMLAAAAIYKEMYGNNEGVPATYQIIYFIGWKPDPSQPKPAARGSGEFSIKDLGRLEELTKEIRTLRYDDPDGKPRSDDQDDLDGKPKSDDQDDHDGKPRSDDPDDEKKE